MPALAKELGISRQRVHQIAKSMYYVPRTAKKDEMYARARIMRHLLNNGMSHRDIDFVFNKTGQYATKIVHRHLTQQYVMKSGDNNPKI